MSGKHRKSPSRSTSHRRTPGLSAVALSVAGLTTAVVAGQNAATVSAPVDLMALITPANSTAQIFASSDYYNHDWSQYGSPQVVPFFLGPQGIADAIDANIADPRGVAVLASGWGADRHRARRHELAQRSGAEQRRTGRTGQQHQPRRWRLLDDVRMFAPLLGTSAAPPPDNLPVPVVDTAYEYNINYRSHLPHQPAGRCRQPDGLRLRLRRAGEGTDAGRGPAGPRGLGRPALRRRAGRDLHQDLRRRHHHLRDIRVPRWPAAGTSAADDPRRRRPGRRHRTAATALVNAGYQDNKPIPDNPRVPRPAGLLPPASHNTVTAPQLPSAAQRSAGKARNANAKPSPAITPKPTPATKAAKATGAAGSARSLAPHRSRASAASAASEKP